jgi:hypothetical protein
VIAVCRGVKASTVKPKPQGVAYLRWNDVEPRFSVKLILVFEAPVRFTLQVIEERIMLVSLSITYPYRIAKPS